MENWVARIDPYLVALAFAAAMAGCWGLGRWWGRRSAPAAGEDPETKFIDASLTLLALLLAFTFSMALNRHEERRLAVVAEGNAIADFYTCASLLKEPGRSMLQQAIGAYARHESATRYERSSEAALREATQRSLDLYGRMTDIVDQAVTAGTPIAVPLTNTLNNVSSCTSSRHAAYEDRLPWSIVALLFLSAVISSFLIGAKQGELRRAHMFTLLSFIIMVPLVIFVTLDLNQPHGGLIVVSQEPMERVIQSMVK